MAITYSPKQWSGDHFAEIFSEILHQNNTLALSKVRLIDNIKSKIQLTEMDLTLSVVAYSCAAPSSAGGITIKDWTLEPIKHQAYQEFCEEDVRQSFFSLTMRPGAWETASTEFERVVLERFGRKFSLEMENRFWNGITTATAAAIAALTPGTAQNQISTQEQARAALLPNGLFDGILAKLMYFNGAVGQRIKVAGTTVSSSNIYAEYDKIYAAMPSALLEEGNVEQLRIYAPYSHKQFIFQYNNIPTNFNQPFTVVNNTDFYFYGIKIEFVPLPANVVIAGDMMSLVWGTDLTADYGSVEINKVRNNGDELFIRMKATLDAQVMVPQQIVLYVG